MALRFPDPQESAKPAGPNSTTAPSSPALSTGTNRPPPPVAVRSVKQRRYDPPWRRVALRYMKGGDRTPPRPVKSLTELYRLLGWTESTAYQRRKWSNLRLQWAAQMARALRAPLAEFLETLALEEGIPESKALPPQKPRVPVASHARTSPASPPCSQAATELREVAAKRPRARRPQVTRCKMPRRDEA